MCNVLLSRELKFLQDRHGFFFKPRYPRYAIDLSHPAIRYAIAAAMPLLFQITAHVWFILKAKTRLSERSCVTWFSLTKIIFVFAGVYYVSVFAFSPRQSEQAN